MPPDTDTPGLATENETKPEITKEISAGSGLHSPDDVAKTIMQDSLNGNFFSCVGLEGNLLGILCSGMAPPNSWMELIGQVCCSTFHLEVMHHMRYVNCMLIVELKYILKTIIKISLF